MEENIRNINKDSEEFKSKLDEMKQLCYDEMNKKYQNILKKKVEEIQKTILEDVQKQNQIILDSYVKQFEELEKKRENDFSQMSKLMLGEGKEEAIIFSSIKTTHHGIKCNKCQTEPIVGYRYKCSVCKDYNLCEKCEQKNSETEEHAHNFIKMRNEERKHEEKQEKKQEKQEKKQEKQEKKQEKQEKQVKQEKQEVKEEEYNYQVMNNDLQKKVTEFKDKEVNFEVSLKNIGILNWPKGKTKLINDPKSDLKANNMDLPDLQINKEQKIKITLNIEKMRAGEKQCIYHFNVEGKNYGNPLILKVIMEEDENVIKMRTEFELSTEEYDSEKLFNALKKNNNDINKAFSSLYQN